MIRRVDGFIWRMGYLMLVMAAFVLLLFVMNLRSRIYYQGPNYSFLVWIFIYCFITGVGLLRLRKWAVISLFLPAALDLLILLSGFQELIHGLVSSWVLLNVLVLAVFIGIPVGMLRHWKELQWRM